MGLARIGGNRGMGGERGKRLTLFGRQESHYFGCIYMYIDRRIKVSLQNTLRSKSIIQVERERQKEKKGAFSLYFNAWKLFCMYMC